MKVEMLAHSATFVVSSQQMDVVRIFDLLQNRIIVSSLNYSSRVFLSCDDTFIANK